MLSQQLKVANPIVSSPFTFGLKVRYFDLERFLPLLNNLNKIRKSVIFWYMKMEVLFLR